MEIASHIELTQDPLPKGTVGGKVPETRKDHLGPLNFPSSLGLNVWLSLKSPWISEKLYLLILVHALWKHLAPRDLGDETEQNCPKHKALFTWHWGKEHEWRGRCSERGFLQCQSVMGSLQAKRKVWVCQVSPFSGYGGLDPQALFL